jgi:hypothetical protein
MPASDPGGALLCARRTARDQSVVSGHYSLVAEASPLGFEIESAQRLAPRDGALTRDGACDIRVPDGSNGKSRRFAVIADRASDAPVGSDCRCLGNGRYLAPFD